MMAGKGTKNGRVKLPKQVAGVKIPKPLRKEGERLIAEAQSEAGRAAIAKGVAAVAGLAVTAVQAAATRRAAAAAPPGASPAPAPTPAKPPAPAPSADHADRAGPDGERVKEAISTVADALLSRLFAGKR